MNSIIRIPTVSYPVIETFFSSQYVNKACVFTQNLFISVSLFSCPQEKRYFNISFFIKQSKTIKIHEISIDFLYLLLDIYKILNLILSISLTITTNNNNTKLLYWYYYKCYLLLFRLLVDLLIIAKNLQKIKKKDVIYAN